MYTKASLERYSRNFIEDQEVREAFDARVATIPFRGTTGKEVCNGVELEMALTDKSLHTAELSPIIIEALIRGFEDRLMEVVTEEDCQAVDELTGMQCLRPAEQVAQNRKFGIPW